MGQNIHQTRYKHSTQSSCRCENDQLLLNLFIWQWARNKQQPAKMVTWSISQIKYKGKVRINTKDNIHSGDGQKTSDGFMCVAAEQVSSRQHGWLQSNLQCIKWWSVWLPVCLSSQRRLMEDSQELLERCVLFQSFNVCVIITLLASHFIDGELNE